ncbi:hypothetical protein BFU36_06695 [Sulfolobus sp. A20]|uniref:DUF4364 family protein n=1 Tax=Sulfolobaceae TaxID=118883 RepID=UPI00084621DA|nr:MULTISPECIES: DUF4364 family protein [unclassified Sulfolobus]TRM75270.1 DUF4364 domain-containing protein [Sulfolobus sp. E5]TRM77102.1 DUF4364 domain-containing protein [Sulfolobus sp. A20-N-F8]TRM78913.1 DUF4364 domain-containing protein [Sulfolobus sp. B5]TRM83143.1 DUF4364 domain-containing protein [Sulfolobus sp. A20-N-F6]TRM86736.1 DUF4364 domain-containing protein [Sulfolobus sp. E3]TRM99072.1 DUF4364 domain-containing protein [Sulfolobus sp. E1]
MNYKIRKRSSIEIILDILKSCEESCNITKVIYEAGINYAVAQKYVNELIKVNVLIVEGEGNKKLYKLTEKGKVLKEHLEEFLELRNKLELEREKLKELFARSMIL